MPLLQKNMRWLLPLLVLLILVTYVYVLWNYAGIDLNYAAADGMISISMLCLAIWGLQLVLNAYPTNVGVMMFVTILATAFSITSIIASKLLLRWWVGAEQADYITWLNSTTPVRYIISWLICAWLTTNSALQKTVSTLEDKFQQHADTSTLLREAELYKLRQQLQPHFLYNSLNSINALTMIDPAKAQDMIGKLSDFLRSSVKREGQELIPVSEEMAYIEAYLSIEAVRFGDRLHVEFNKEGIDDAHLPPFLLQPLLENAIKFGLYGKTGAVTISVHIRMDSNVLNITITNPYDGDSFLPKGTGFGLKGIERRLYLIYARTDLLETKKTESLFITTLKIPQHV